MSRRRGCSLLVRGFNPLGDNKVDALLVIIIAIVVFGVFLGVARLCIQKFFPEFMEYFQILVWVALAALFIFLLIQIWPFLTGAITPHH